MLVNCANYLSMLIILHYTFTVVKVKSLTGREFSQVFHLYPVKAKKERKGGNALGIPALHERMKECDRKRHVLGVLFYHSLSRLASVLFAVFFRASACRRLRPRRRRSGSMRRMRSCRGVPSWRICLGSTPGVSSERWISPSMPSSMRAKAPNGAIFVMTPVTT